MPIATASRKQRLRTLEKEIRSGMEEFYYVGQKLKEIRDDELYKEDGFETWESYCRERWEWSRDYTYKLIAASEYREKLPAPTSGIHSWSERSVRELTRIPDKKQAARVAKKIVAEVERSEKQAAKNPDVKPLKLSSSTVRKFVDDDLGIKSKPKPKPDRVANGIAHADYIRSKIGLIEGITEVLADLPADSWKWLEVNEPGLAERLAAACDALASLMRS